MPSPNKKIDLNIIEELKKRRGQRNVCCEELEARRDDLVSKIQEEMFATGRHDLPRKIDC